MKNEFDFWLHFRADVAKAILPKAYDEAKQRAAECHSFRPAKHEAIEEAIDIAVTMAERLEARIKGDSQ